MTKEKSNSAIDPIVTGVNGSLSERISELMNGRSARLVAENWGIGASTLNAYIKKGSVPNLNIAHQIAIKEGVSLQWLATGVDEERFVEYAQHKPNSFETEFAIIPGYRVQVSAGHGSLISEDTEPTRHLAFRRKWLKFRGFNEKDLVIVWAKGDSMEPTINNNDTLVIHLGRNKPADGHIYIFRNGDELFVKRYQNGVGSWRLISDSPMYETLSIPKEEQHQFEVIGQVIHIAKDVGN